MGRILLCCKITTWNCTPLGKMCVFYMAEYGMVMPFDHSKPIQPMYTGNVIDVV